MRKLLCLLAALLFGVPAYSQLTTINANLIQHDVSGVLLTSGFFQLIPVNSQGQVAAFTGCTGGQILPIAYTWPIVNGVIVGGAQVPDTSCSTPSGVGYQVSITTVNGAVLYTYGNPIHPTGSTWSFDTWAPTSVVFVPAAGLFYGSSWPTGAGVCTSPSLFIVNATTEATCIGTSWVQLTNLNPIVSWQGAWSSTTTYSVGKGVSYNGSSYVSTASSTNAIPSSSPSLWQLLSAGTTGATGATGPAGTAGATGAAGAAATIAVGTVSGLAAGSTPTVMNTGTPSAAIFAFAIPAGATGATGPAGAAGAVGATGAAGSPGATGPAGATGPQGPAGPAPSGNGYVIVTGGLPSAVSYVGALTQTLCSGLVTLSTSTTVPSGGYAVLGTFSCPGLDSATACGGAQCYDSPIASFWGTPFTVTGFVPSTSGGLQLTAIGSLNTITVYAINQTTTNPYTLSSGQQLVIRGLR